MPQCYTTPKLKGTPTRLSLLPCIIAGLIVVAFLIGPLQKNGLPGAHAADSGQNGASAATAALPAATYASIDGVNTQTKAYYASLNGDGTVGTWNTAAALPANVYDSALAVSNTMLSAGFICGQNVGGPS